MRAHGASFLSWLVRPHDSREIYMPLGYTLYGPLHLSIEPALRIGFDVVHLLCVEGRVL